MAPRILIQLQIFALTLATYQSCPTSQFLWWWMGLGVTVKDAWSSGNPSKNIMK